MILSYIELFGRARVSKLVFVDQAPLQNRAEGWEIGSKGCYDEASLHKLQAALVADLEECAVGTVKGCTSLALPDELKKARHSSETPARRLSPPRSPALTRGGPPAPTGPDRRNAQVRRAAARGADAGPHAARLAAAAPDAARAPCPQLRRRPVWRVPC